MADLKSTKEYFCYSCGQLRLSICGIFCKCSNCGGTKLLIGEPGELDKAMLKYDFNHRIVK